MRRLFGILCLAALSMGCGNEFRSLNPIALPGDRSPVPGLAGDWVVVPEDDFSGGIVRFLEIPSRQGEYLISMIDSVGKTEHLHALPTRIGGRLILDVWQEPVIDDADLLAPLHTPVYLDGAGSDTLRLATLVGRELVAFLEREPARLAHAWVRRTADADDPSLVVTASTAEIRRFIERYQIRTNAIDHEAPITLRRLK